MRLTAALSALAVSALLATSTAQAHGLTAQQQHHYQSLFQRADHKVKWIGHHARITQYNPDPRVKRRWQAAAKFWVTARHKAWLTLHPPLLYPPHHKLWGCISDSEGGVHTNTGNGYYGMLQMSYNWLGYISGRASDYSQAEQEWAAERAYRDSGYDSNFLAGQWFKWDGRYDCLKYA